MQNPMIQQMVRSSSSFCQVVLIARLYRWLELVELEEECLILVRCELTSTDPRIVADSLRRMNDPMMRNMMNQMGGGGAGRPGAQGDTDDGNDGPADMYS